MRMMHENELDISTKMVDHLIKQQCPQYNTLSLKRIPSSSTVHALYQLGQQFVVRLPRIQATQGIEKEWAWLKHLSPHLDISISEPIFRGNPSEFYPWPWLISHYYPGITPSFEKQNEHSWLAIALADFLNQFHKIPLIEDAPQSRRGVPLKDLDKQTRQEIVSIGDEFDTTKLVKLWQTFSNLSTWEHEPVWVHGDMLPGNILVNHQMISAVIDFSDVGTGDPACDLIIAWALFNKHSRAIFKKHLQNIDENTWLRGKGWALSIAAIMLPYYKNSNPDFAELARRILTQINEPE